MNSHSERGSLRVATALVIGLLSAGTARACDDLRADKAICSTHLLLLWDALNNYRKAHKELPAKLSDLHPQFLTDPEILFCPVARRKGKPPEPDARARSPGETGESCKRASDPGSARSRHAGRMKK